MNARHIALALGFLCLGSTPTFAGSTDAGRGAWEGLSADAQKALDAGHVVLLETVDEKTVLGTRLVAVIETNPTDVIETLRDYDAMSDMPEVRKVSSTKGETRDTFAVTVKPHPLLPSMNFTKAVEWSLDGEGAARVGISLLDTTSDYVSDQKAEYEILPLDGERSLVFYETRSTYAKLSFRRKVLAGTCASAQAWLGDLRDRAAAKKAEQDRSRSALALLAAPGALAPTTR